MSSVWYVYGIVPTGTDFSGGPPGLDDFAVTIASSGSVAALTSALPEESYGAAPLEQRTSDVEWLGSRAIAHDRVLTWASDHGPVVPFPMFSAMFSGRAAIESMLRDRESELSDALQRIGGAREYSLRIYRVDAELRGALPELSAEMGELAAAAAAASPGQRYLLERKLDERARQEVGGVGRTVAAQAYEALSAQVSAAVASPIPCPSAGAPGTMVLNSAFLVADDQLRHFQQVLTDLVGRYGARGFRFDFTGPWPAYHFVTGTASMSADDDALDSNEPMVLSDLVNRVLDKGAVITGHVVISVANVDLLMLDLRLLLSSIESALKRDSSADSSVLPGPRLRF